MPNLQRRMAAKVLKVGKDKVWMDPKKREDISKAITRADVRRLILKGSIKKKSGKIPKPKEARAKRKGHGSRKGPKHSVVKSKRKWINTIRPLRRELVEMKSSGRIDGATYQRMRSLAKGGMFRSRSHLRLYLEQHGLLKKEIERQKK